MVLSVEIVQGKVWEHLTSFSWTFFWEHFFQNQDDENYQYFIFSQKLYLQYQKTFLFSSINHIQKKFRKKIVHNCCNIALNLVGYGRSASPGLNAKYGTYTLMNSKTNQTIVCHVSCAVLTGNSVRMEKRGISILLEKFRRIGITIKSLITDRQIQTKFCLAKEHPDIMAPVWY